MMSVNVHLREVSLGSDQFDGSDGPAFTSVRIKDGTGNDVSLFVNADVAGIALELADAIRAAALKYMPASEPAAVEV